MGIGPRVPVPPRKPTIREIKEAYPITKNEFLLIGFCVGVLLGLGIGLML